VRGESGFNQLKVSGKKLEEGKSEICGGKATEVRQVAPAEEQ
jgi:hypothetical protein